MTLPRVSVRALPERHDYSLVDGCEVATHCLTCPLPVCKHEDDMKYDSALIFQLRKQGVSPTELMRQFKLSERTIYRIIERGGAPPLRARQIYDAGPLVDVQDLKPNSFKLRPKVAPAFIPRARRSSLHLRACVRCCGDVEVDLLWREARCVQCGRDPRT